MQPNKKSRQVIIRPAKPGEASYISYLHMKLYQGVYGFRPLFEYYLLKALAEYLHSPERSELWIAEIGGEIAGSIAIVQSEKEDTAQLRWFVIDEKYQGCGIGKKLAETAMQFCIASKYKHIFLWTVDFLKAARHIYSTYGFRLTETVENNEWTDATIIEERWDLDL